MLEKNLTRGLLLAATLALLGACSAVKTSDPQVVPKPLPTVDNICSWPDYGYPESARGMLDVIGDLARVASDQGQIDFALMERLEAAIERCKSPDLRNAAGRHVCHLQNPKPCDELREIKLHAEDLEYPPAPPPLDGEKRPVVAQPTTLPQHWGTIATELESFPTGE